MNHSVTGIWGNPPAAAFPSQKRNTSEFTCDPTWMPRLNFRGVPSGTLGGGHTAGAREADTTKPRPCARGVLGDVVMGLWDGAGCHQDAGSASKGKAPWTVFVTLHSPESGVS